MITSGCSVRRSDMNARAKKFHKDLAGAEVHQARVKELIELNLNGCEALDEPSCKGYDMAFKYDGKRFTVECKEDFASKESGNFFCEFECTKKPSGIQTTTATYYVITMAVQNGDYKDYIVRTSVLRELIDEGRYVRIVEGGGDNGTVKGYLFRVSNLILNENFIELKRNA